MADMDIARSASFCRSRDDLSIIKRLSGSGVKRDGTIWNFVLEAFWLLYDFEPFSEQNSELGLCLGPFAC